MKALNRQVALRKQENIKIESILNPEYFFRVDGLGKEGKKFLVNELKKIHTYNVCSVIDRITEMTLEIEAEKLST